MDTVIAANHASTNLIRVQFRQLVKMYRCAISAAHVTIKDQSEVILLSEKMKQLITNPLIFTHDRKRDLNLFDNFIQSLYLLNVQCFYKRNLLQLLAFALEAGLSFNSQHILMVYSEALSNQCGGGSFWPTPAHEHKESMVLIRVLVNRIGENDLYERVDYSWFWHSHLVLQMMEKDEFQVILNGRICPWSPPSNSEAALSLTSTIITHTKRAIKEHSSCSKELVNSLFECLRAHQRRRTLIWQTVDALLLPELACIVMSYESFGPSNAGNAQFMIEYEKKKIEMADSRSWN